MFFSDNPTVLSEFNLQSDCKVLFWRGGKNFYITKEKLLKYSFHIVISSEARNLVGDFERISQIPRRYAPRNDDDVAFFRCLIETKREVAQPG